MSIKILHLSYLALNSSIFKRSMRKNVNQRAISAATAAMYAYVEIQSVGTNTIAIAMTNKSLLPLLESQCILGAKDRGT